MLFIRRSNLDSKFLSRASKYNLHQKTNNIVTIRRQLFYEYFIKNYPSYGKFTGIWKNGRKPKDDEKEWEDKRQHEIIKIEQRKHRNLDRDRCILDTYIDKVDYYDIKMHPKEVQDWHYSRCQQGVNTRKEQLTEEMTDEEWEQPLVNVKTFTWKSYAYDLILNPDYHYEPKDEFFYFAIVSFLYIKFRY